MGQIVGGAAKPKRCNLNKLSQLGTPAAGEYILVSSDNSMNAAGQGNFDCYIEGDGQKAATALELKKIGDVYKFMDKTIHKSTNLLNKNAATENRYVNKNTGALASLNGYYATDFIPVSEAGLYITKFLVGGAAIGGAVYGPNKNYIRNLGNPTRGNLIYTYVDGDAYIRYTIQNSTNLDAAMVNVGTSPLPYEEYYAPYSEYTIKQDVLPETEIGIEDITFKEIELGRNLLNNAEIEDDFYINKNNGNKVSGATGYCVTPFIPLNKKNIYCPNGTTYGGVGGAAIYDENKVYVREADSSQTAIYTNTSDCYVRFVMNSVLKNTATAAYYDRSPRLFPYTQYSEKEVVNDIMKIGINRVDFSSKQAVGKNLFDKNSCVPYFYINSNGNFIIENPNAGTLTVVSDYIPVDKGGIIATSVAAGASWHAVYDENYNLIRLFTGDKYTYEEGDAYVQFTLLYDDLETIRIEKGTEITGDYEAYKGKTLINPSALPTMPIDESSVLSTLSSNKYFTNEVIISLPDTIHAVVGDTLQLFFQGIVCSANWEKYWVHASCAKGTNYRRYFQYTPEVADIGTTTLTIYVCDDNENILAQKSCQLVTSAAPVSPSTAKNIMPVGASTTANGIWPAEVIRRLTGSGGTPAGNGISNISLVGQATKDGAGFLGRSGWGWSDYVSSQRAAYRFTLAGSPSVSMGAVYTNNGHQYTIIEIVDDTILCSTSSASNTPSASGTLTKYSGSGDSSLTFTAVTADAANPFWDNTNSKMSFVNYVNNYCGGSIDAVVTLLGYNGISGGISNMMANVKIFADTLHSEYPNAKLIIMGEHFPSMKLMMPAYRASGTLSNIYNDLRLVAQLNEAYQEFANQDGYSDFVQFVNVSSELDSDYNFPITQKDVNTRNSTYKEPYANNGVHPDNEGYLQIADAAYRSIVAEFCQ